MSKRTEPETTIESIVEDLKKLGVDSATLEHIRSMAGVGNYMATRGDRDYSLGVVVGQIELLRNAQEQWQNLLKAPDLDPVVKASLYEKISGNASTISLLVKQVMGSGDSSRKKNKKRSQSFRPGEAVSGESEIVVVPKAAV